MSNEQLDREALLTLYAADELPAEQRVELEAQLAGDPALAAEALLARQTLDRALASLEQADRLQRLPVNEGVAVRRAGRVIQQWAVDRARAKVEPEKKRQPMPWWIYPAAAAAVLIVGFLIWSGRQEIPEMPAVRNTLSDQLQAEDVEEALADRLDATFGNESTVAMAVDDPAAAQLPAGIDDGGTFFLTPREEFSP